MSTEKFQIFYRGSDVADGSMSVKELAPSLLALGEAFEEINLLVNQKDASIKINVRAVHQGSFGVSLEIVTSLPTQISALLGTISLKDAATIIAILFGSGGLLKGLIELVRFAKNRKPDKATVIETDTVRLEFSGNNNKVENIVVNQNVYNSFINIPVRRSMEKFVEPLNRSGIDEIVAVQNDKESQKITKKEALYFRAPVLDEVQLGEQETEMVLSIIMLSFKGESWRMSDGQNAFWVMIRDTQFLNQVEANRAAFTKGDKLRMRMRVVQTQTPENELKTQYEAMEVLEHIRGTLQLHLELEDGTKTKKSKRAPESAHKPSATRTPKSGRKAKKSEKR